MALEFRPGVGRKRASMVSMSNSRGKLPSLWCQIWHVKSMAADQAFNPFHNDHRWLVLVQSRPFVPFLWPFRTALAIVIRSLGP